MRAICGFEKWFQYCPSKLTTNRREENLNIRTRDQLWIHSIGHSEKRTTEIRLGGTKATSDFWEIPNRLDGGLGTNRLTRWKQNFTISLETASCDRFTAFGQIDVGLGYRDRGANVPVKERSECKFSKIRFDDMKNTNDDYCSQLEKLPTIPSWASLCRPQ